MPHLMWIIIQIFSRAKFSRLDIDPRKTRKLSGSKICHYTIRTSECGALHYLKIGTRWVGSELSSQEQGETGLPTRQTSVSGSSTDEQASFRLSALTLQNGRPQIEPTLP